MALRTLLEERSVTRAAERLFVTQPAMSKTLHRLRELFDDELFTRSARGLIPTPKALELEQPLMVALEYLESTVFGSRFEPGSTRGEIHICAPEMFAVTAVPELATILSEQSPGVLLKSRNLLDDYIDLLAHGTLDFAIYVNQQLNDDYVTYPIITGAPSIWLPANHPLAEKASLDISDLNGMPSVSVYLPGVTTDIQGLQSVFDAHDITLQPIVQTTQLLIAMEVISRKGAFMLGPQLIDKSMLASGSIVTRPLNNVEELLPMTKLELVLIQHQRTLNSPLHTWIRELILSIYKHYE